METLSEWRLIWLLSDIVSLLITIPNLNVDETTKHAIRLIKDRRSYEECFHAIENVFHLVRPLIKKHSQEFIASKLSELKGKHQNGLSRLHFFIRVLYLQIENFETSPLAIRDKAMACAGAFLSLGDTGLSFSIRGATKYLWSRMVCDVFLAFGVPCDLILALDVKGRLQASDEELMKTEAELIEIVNTELKKYFDMHILERSSCNNIFQACPNVGPLLHQHYKENRCFEDVIVTKLLELNKSLPPAIDAIPCYDIEADTGPWNACLRPVRSTPTQKLSLHSIHKSEDQNSKLQSFMKDITPEKIESVLGTLSPEDRESILSLSMEDILNSFEDDQCHTILKEFFKNDIFKNDMLDDKLAVKYLIQAKFVDIDVAKQRENMEMLMKSRKGRWLNIQNRIVKFMKSTLAFPNPELHFAENLNMRVDDIMDVLNVQQPAHMVCESPFYGYSSMLATLESDQIPLPRSMLRVPRGAFRCMKCNTLCPNDTRFSTKLDFEFLFQCECSLADQCHECWGVAFKATRTLSKCGTKNELSLKEIQLKIQQPLTLSDFSNENPDIPPCIRPRHFHSDAANMINQARLARPILSVLEKSNRCVYEDVFRQFQKFVMFKIRQQDIKMVHTLVEMISHIAGVLGQCSPEISETSKARDQDLYSLGIVESFVKLFNTNEIESENSIAQLKSLLISTELVIALENCSSSQQRLTTLELSLPSSTVRSIDGNISQKDMANLIKSPHIDHTGELDTARNSFRKSVQTLVENHLNRIRSICVEILVAFAIILDDDESDEDEGEPCESENRSILDDLLAQLPQADGQTIRWRKEHFKECIDEFSDTERLMLESLVGICQKIPVTFAHQIVSIYNQCNQHPSEAHGQENSTRIAYHDNTELDSILRDILACHESSKSLRGTVDNIPALLRSVANTCDREALNVANSEAEFSLVLAKRHSWVAVYIESFYSVCALVVLNKINGYFLRMQANASLLESEDDLKKKRNKTAKKKKPNRVVVPSKAPEPIDAPVAHVSQTVNTVEKRSKPPVEIEKRTCEITNPTAEEEWQVVKAQTKSKLQKAAPRGENNTKTQKEKKQTRKKPQAVLSEKKQQKNTGIASNTHDSASSDKVAEPIITLDERVDNVANQESPTRPLEISDSIITLDERVGDVANQEPTTRPPEIPDIEEEASAQIVDENHDKEFGVELLPGTILLVGGHGKLDIQSKIANSDEVSSQQVNVTRAEEDITEANTSDNASIVPNTTEDGSTAHMEEDSIPRNIETYTETIPSQVAEPAYQHDTSNEVPGNHEGHQQEFDHNMMQAHAMENPPYHVDGYLAMPPPMYTAAPMHIYTPHPHGPMPPPMFVQSYCRHFLKGYCRYGDHCRMRHVSALQMHDEMAAMSMPQHPSWGPYHPPPMYWPHGVPSYPPP